MSIDIKFFFSKLIHFPAGIGLKKTLHCGLISGNGCNNFGWVVSGAQSCICELSIIPF